MHKILFFYRQMLLLLPLLMVGLIPVASAQKNELEKSVHEVINLYQSASALELDFEFQLTYPEQKPEIFKGQFFKKGDEYLVKLKEYTIISDGKVQYTIQEEMKEVQITDVDEETMELSSPSGILQYLSSYEFKYFDKSELKQGGQSLRIIEMVPEDRDSDYFKIRFSFIATSKQLKYIEIFARDGMRIQLTIERTSFSGNFTTDSIQWNEEKYKGYYIEDLRID